MVKQPRQSNKVVDEDRRFDRTALTETSRGDGVSRDYAAHFFRWGFTDNFVEDGVTRILDVGCGIDCALARVISRNVHYRIKKYVGVDLNKQPRRVVGNRWAEFKWEFEFTSMWKSLGTFDLVTCFEVIEHMGVPDGRKLLKGLKGCCEPGGTILLSTPVFSGKAAANHIHEYRVDELKLEIEKSGLRVINRFGTFARSDKIKKVVTKEELTLIKELNKWYTWDVLSCFLAPKYPDASSNNIWVLKHKE